MFNKIIIIITVFLSFSCGKNVSEISVCSEKDCEFELFSPNFIRIFDGLNYKWMKVESQALEPVKFIDLSEIPLYAQGSSILAKKNDENGLALALYKKSGRGYEKVIHKLDPEIKEVLSACATDFNFWTIETAQSQETGEKLFILSSYDTNLKNKEFYLLLKADKFLALSSLIKDQILYEEPSSISCSKSGVFVLTVLYYSSFSQLTVYKFDLANQSITPQLSYFPISKGGIAKFYNSEEDSLYVHQKNILNIQKGLGFPESALLKTDSEVLIFDDNGKTTFLTTVKEEKKIKKIRLFQKKGLDIFK